MPCRKVPFSLLLQSVIDKMAALPEGFAFTCLRPEELGGLVVGSALLGIVVLSGSQGIVVVGSQGIVVSCCGGVVGDGVPVHGCGVGGGVGGWHGGGAGGSVG